MCAVVLVFFLALVLSVSLGGGAGTAIAIFVAVLGIAFAVYYSGKQKRQSEKEDQDNYIEERGIHPDTDFQFQNTLNTISVRYIVDNSQETVFISITGSSFISIPFSDINGCEIIVDSEVKGGVGRAIVGGFLAGGAGAVVGATTAKKKTSSYQVVIYKKTIQDPSLVITLINSETDVSSIEYQDAVTFAYKVNASIKAIIEQNAHSISDITPSSNKAIDDTPEAIRKYKNLLDEGIITKEEFEEKKRQLLGL